MKPEARLQSWCHKFLERVVLPPMFTTAIEVGHDWGAKKLQHTAALQARGATFGLPDCMVAQGDGQELERVIWIEYKRGTSLTARQAGVHALLRRVGFEVYTCSSIADVLDALRLSGLRLHANAANIATEYEQRLLASDAKEAARPKRSTSAKPRAKATPARLAKLRSLGIPV